MSEVDRRADAHRRLITCISHPLRHRLLMRLHHVVASPKELADELGEPLGRVSHHVRTLERIGAIELVRAEQRRGAVEHYYRAVQAGYFSDEDWARLPLATRREIIGQHLQQIMGDMATAHADDGFDHLRACVSFMWLELDERGMERMSELLKRTLDEAMEIHTESALRLDGGERPLLTQLTLLHFERSSQAARAAGEQRA
jgi:DNA-binding transcriptional ArsR family regulator